MTENLVKVGIQTDDHVETLWAQSVGLNQYRLDNSPFFAYDVSWRDIVEALPDHTGMLMMRRVVAKSGHRTVRIILPSDARTDANAQLVLNEINALGCTYEGTGGQYVTVDLPPEVNLEKVVTFLTERGVEWEHADPSYEHLYGRE